MLGESVKKEKKNREGKTEIERAKGRKIKMGRAREMTGK